MGINFLGLLGRLLQTGWLGTTEIDSHTVLETRIHKCARVRAPSYESIILRYLHQWFWWPCPPPTAPNTWSISQCWKWVSCPWDSLANDRFSPWSGLPGPVTHKERRMTLAYSDKQKQWHKAFSIGPTEAPTIPLGRPAQPPHCWVKGLHFLQL